MPKVSEQVEEYLLDLAWSLWSELGVAGLHRKHRFYLIVPEELILLTAVLGNADPRLREEALDWCSRYSSFISVARLKTLIKTLGELVFLPFSLFATTLNSVCSAKWPLSQKTSPLKLKVSGKSKLPDFESPALLSLRLRALFGVGARADLLLFFFSQEETDYAISDTVEIGYSKRNLADMLEGFAQSGIFQSSFERNQKRYRFTKQKDFAKILGPLPKIMPSWRHLLEVVLRLRDCIRRNEAKTEEVQVIELRNTLLDMEPLFRRLHLTPPPMQSNFWTVFIDWFLGELRIFSQGTP